MAYDALSTVFSVLSERWDGFQLKKSKKMWIKEAEDKVLLLIQIQSSSWGKMYYLNFGVHFLEISPIDKPLSNLPRLSSWHVVGRYEDFQELSTSGYNKLFSLEEADSASLEERCAHIAIFTKQKILPLLRVIGDTKCFSERLLQTDSEKILYPLRAQSIRKEKIIQHIEKKCVARKS